MFEQIRGFFNLNPWKISYRMPVTKNGTFIEYFRPKMCCDGIARRAVHRNGTEFLTRLDEAGNVRSLCESTPLGEIRTIWGTDGTKNIMVRTKGTPQITDVTKSPQLKEILDSIRLKPSKPNSSNTSLGVNGIRKDWA